MPPRVYIDGRAGTTGLELTQRLETRADLTLLGVEDARRKDPEARRELMRRADVTVLCLPDDAAREAVELGGDLATRWLDASSAHRVAPGWVYGLPELAAGQRGLIASARRVSNPGCYPTGVVLLLRPLIERGLLAADAPLAIHALSGHSGGGNKLIDRWRDPGLGLAELPFEAPYALDTRHKHLPEMVAYSKLAEPPHFVPAAGPFYSGMRVQIPLHRGILRGDASAHALWHALDERYRGEPFVRLVPFDAPSPDERALDPRRMNGTNTLELRVVESPFGHVLLVATLDNLGKGAAGAAVQNLNLMLGFDETAGLLRAPS
jgi:N-acetyl-gamma-glutamyl-phosphate reductase